jgi:hypothetical protein
MKIENVIVENFTWGCQPGFWEKAAASPDEPLLELQINMTVSLNEYKEILEKSKVTERSEYERPIQP